MMRSEVERERRITSNILKQAQEYRALRRTQERLGREEVAGESSSGMVKVTMNGRHEVNGVDRSLPVGRR